MSTSAIERRVGKLTAEQVRQIVKRRRAGERVSVLAEEFGVAKSAISYHTNHLRVGAKPIDHGTYRGRQQHLRAGSKPCSDCAEAHRTYMRNYTRQTARARRSSAVLIEDIEFLLEHNLWTLEGLAARLGVKPNTIEVCCHRAGRKDLTNRIIANTQSRGNAA